VRGQRHAPAASTPGKDPVRIVQEAGWASEPVWTGEENLAPHRDSIPGSIRVYTGIIKTWLPALMRQLSCSVSKATAGPINLTHGAHTFGTMWSVCEHAIKHTKWRRINYTL